MERRHFLLGVGGATAAFAGCAGGGGSAAGGDDEPTEDGGTSGDGGQEPTDGGIPEDALEELPEIEELLAQHHDTLDASAFEATERVKPAGTGDDGMAGKTIRHEGDHTLLEGDDVGRFRESDGKETAWLTDHARIESAGFSIPLHTYYPDGTPVSYIDGEVVSQIVQIATFERVDVTGEDERVYVFEATGAEETSQAESSVELRSVDVRIAVSERQYVRSFDAEITVARSAEAEETSTAIYHYEVTRMGDVSVSEPAFVDDAMRIEGDLTEDGAALALEHAGGPPLPAGTTLTIQDAAAIPREGPTVPDAFEPGDVAYVYWTSADGAAVSLGEEPSEVARPFSLPSGRGERNVYLRDEGRRFEVRFSRQA